VNRPVVRADVCIVGAGPAGITVARELIAAGLDVVMLETGDLDENPAMGELLRGKAVGPVIKDYQTYLTDSRRFQVGGSGYAWGRGPRIWCVPLSPIDFEKRDWVEHSGWPISYEELKPYLDEASRALGVGHFNETRPLRRPTGTPSPDVVTHAFHYPVDSGVLQRDFRALCAHERFRVETGATATSFSASDGRVDAVRAQGRDGDDLWIEAGEFVLAAGGIENARILMIQNRADPRRPLAESGALGRYFMEHFHCYAGTVTVPDGAPWHEYLAATEDPVHRHTWMRILGLADEVQARERLLNTSCQLTDKPHDHETPAHPPGTYSVMLRAEQAPNPLSRIVLDTELDSLGRPRVLLEWNVRDQDWASLVRSSSVLADEWSGGHGGVTNLALSEEAPWPWAPADPSASPFPTWGHHHLGTTRMHEDPERGVVDRHGRVHGTANLFVAGSSTFPTGGFANPTLTIVALSIRLGAQIVARRRGPSL
jgi:choline dehydrogenase-like flavoprotein